MADTTIIDMAYGGNTTTMRIHWDEQSLEDTARIVTRLNPCGYSEETLVRYMRTFVKDEPTIAGTLGFYVAACPMDKLNGDGEVLYAKAFPAPWLVAETIK